MAIYYIDPSAGANGTGTVASPYNTWVGVTLTANNTYRQKRGTTYTGASVRPQSQTSSAATPLTIEAYYNPDGSDDDTKPLPVINHNGGTNGVGAVFVDTCAYVVVRNICGTNSNGALGGGIVIRRSQNVTIQNCAGNNSEHGICITQDQASATSTTTDITIDSCVFSNNVSGGITFRWGAVSTAVIKRVRITNNRVYGNGTGKGTGAGAVSVPCGGITSYPVYKTDTNANYRNADIIISGNEVYNNNGYGINVEMASNDQWTSTISDNNIYGNGASLDVDSHSLWVGNSFGVVVDGNEIHNNFAYQNFTSGSGVGIFIDYNGVSTTGGTDNIVRGNLIYEQFSGTTQVQVASSGIHVLNNQTTLVYGNVIKGCRNGITVGPSGTDGTDIYNNTIIGSTEFGVCVQASTNTSVKNNIVSGATTGIFVATSGTTGAAETNNCVHNATVPKGNGTVSTVGTGTLDSSSFNIDPLLYPDFKPRNARLFSAGTTKSGTDYNGNTLPASPSIGAIQCVGVYPRANLTSYQVNGNKISIAGRGRR